MVIVERTGLLYILKLVPGMLLVEITGMLYIGNHKIKFVRVLQSPRDSTN